MGTTPANCSTSLKLGCWQRFSCVAGPTWRLYCGRVRSFEAAIGGFCCYGNRQNHWEMGLRS
eukprot:4690586-Amphidinium_carterae.1